MKKTALFTLMAALGILNGCSSNQFEYGVSKTITFAPSVCNTDEKTRGTLINSSDDFFPTSCDTFRVASYGIEPIVKGNIIPAYTKVKYISEEWKTIDGSGNPQEYCWVTGTTQRFFAYTNMPAIAGAASVSNTDETKQTLTYNAALLTDAANQKDILLGWGEKTAEASTKAEINFRHPLTAVKFTTTEKGLSYHALKKVTISGLAASGSVEMDEDGVISAWSAETWNLAIERTSSFTDVYILIPQDLAEHPVTVSAVLDGDEGDIEASTTVSSGIWASGGINVYELAYSDYKEMGLSISLQDWKPVMNKDTTYFSIDFN